MSTFVSANDPVAWTRDALQARLIARVFAQKVRDLVLKGGMAMRLAHGHVRATKDIDLDADPQIPLDSLKRVVERAVKTATVGLLDQVKTSAPKQTDTVARWKIGGVDPVSRAPVNLTIEISRRAGVDPAHTRLLATPGAGPGDHPVVVYTDQMLAFNKVRALLSPNRSAARDLVDLFLLIRAEVPPPVALLQAWDSDDRTTRITSLWQKIEGLDESRFRAEVLPALGSGGTHLKDWDHVRLTVGQHVEAWLKKANEIPATSRACRQGARPR